MKNLFNKIVSLFMCLCIAVTAIVVTVPRTDAADGTDIPVIYVVGRGDQIVRDNPDGTRESLYPVSLNMEYLMSMAEKHMDVFAKAFFTQVWDEFCDVLYEEVIALYGELALDKGGNVADGSYAPAASWTKESINATKGSNGYGVQQFTFHYDWRLDPLEIADELHRYIEAVMEVTGAEEVALSGRCLGSNIVLAYMQKYDAEHICDLILYCGAHYGVTQCSKAFCGEIYLESDGIERYMYDRDITEDEYIQALLESFLTLFNKTYGLDIATWAVNNVYPDIYLDIVPRILRESLGRFPGYWSMVSRADYEKAKDTVFYGADITEYAELIEKIDYYHYNVQCKIEDLLLEWKSRGIDIYNITKYGNPSLPTHAGTEKMSDGRCYVDDQSFGATAADIDEQLSDEYIDSVIAAGNGKYISPDKQIDASTCLFPNGTWFIKDLAHRFFPTSVNALIAEMVNNDNFTVFDNENYPQYMLHNTQTGAISPLDDTNSNGHERWNVSFLDALRRFLESLYYVLSGLIAAR